MHSERMLLLAFIYWVTVLYEGGEGWRMETSKGMLDFGNGENAFQFGANLAGFVLNHSFIFAECCMYRMSFFLCPRLVRGMVKPVVDRWPKILCLIKL